MILALRSLSLKCEIVWHFSCLKLKRICTGTRSLRAAASLFWDVGHVSCVNVTQGFIYLINPNMITDVVSLKVPLLPCGAVCLSSFSDD